MLLAGILFLRSRPERQAQFCSEPFRLRQHHPAAQVLLLRPASYHRLLGHGPLLFPLLIYRVSRITGPGCLLRHREPAACLCLPADSRPGWRPDGPGAPGAGAELPIVLAALAASAFADSLIGLYVTGVLGAGFAWAWRCPSPADQPGLATRQQGRTLGFTTCWYTGMIAGTRWEAGWCR